MNTRVLVINLGDLYTDYRKKCIIPIDDTFKIVFDVESYLKEKFLIEEAFYLESSGAWIPSFTNIDILSSLDEIRLRLVQPQSERPEEKHEETGTKKKKKKSETESVTKEQLRHQKQRERRNLKQEQSYEPESDELHTVEASENAEEEDSHSETHVKEKKKKKRRNEQTDDVSSLTVEEDFGQIPKKKKKKDKDRDSESAGIQQVGTPIATLLSPADTHFETPSGKSSITLYNTTIDNDPTEETTHIQTPSANVSSTLDTPAINSTEEQFVNLSASSFIALDNSTISNNSTEETTNTTKRKRFRRRKKKSEENAKLTDNVLQKAKQQVMTIINSRLNWHQNQQTKRTHIRFNDDDDDEEITEAASEEVPATCTPVSHPPKSESEFSRHQYEFPIHVKNPFYSNPSTSSVIKSSNETPSNSNPSTSNVFGSSDESVMNTSVSSEKVESEPPKSRYKVPVYYRKPFSNRTVLIAGGVPQTKVVTSPAARTGIVDKFENPTNNEDNFGGVENRIIDECVNNLGSGKDGKDVQKDIGVNDEKNDKESSNVQEEIVQHLNNTGKDVEKEEDSDEEGMKLPDKDGENGMNELKLIFDKDDGKEEEGKNLKEVKLPNKDDKKGMYEDKDESKSSVSGDDSHIADSILELGDYLKSIEYTNGVNENGNKMDVDTDEVRLCDENEKSNNVDKSEASNEERQEEMGSDNENGDKEHVTVAGSYEDGGNEGSSGNGEKSADEENRGKEDTRTVEENGGKKDTRVIEENGATGNVGMEEKGSNKEEMENGGNVKTVKNCNSNPKIEYVRALAVLPLKSTGKLQKCIPLSKPKPRQVVTNTTPDFSVGDIISFQVMYLNSCAMPVVTEQIIGKILSIKNKFKIEVLCGTVKLGAEQSRFSSGDEDEFRISLPGSVVELFLTELIGPKKVEKVLSRCK